MKMTPEARGVYCTLIFSLYEKGGYIEFNDNLAYLCGCSVKKFGTIWKQIEAKFGQKRTKIFHKKVLKELDIARTRSQMLTNIGVKGNEIRWNKGKYDIAGRSPSNPNENENENETRSRREEKRTRREREVKENQHLR